MNNLIKSSAELCGHFGVCAASGFALPTAFNYAFGGGMTSMIGMLVGAPLVYGIGRSIGFFTTKAASIKFFGFAALAIIVHHSMHMAMNAHHNHQIHEFMKNAPMC